MAARMVVVLIVRVAVAMVMVVTVRVDVILVRARCPFLVGSLGGVAVVAVLMSVVHAQRPSVAGSK
jgi:hypothetical protein